MFNDNIMRAPDNYTFDALSVKNAIVSWIREYFRNNGPDCNAVVGISGGKDSCYHVICIKVILSDNT